MAKDSEQAELATAENQTPGNGKPVGNIYYGTSSWTDKTLLESKRFYPPDVDTPAARLRHYAEHFPLVEVDSTYYALPSERNAALWIERTPPHFVFNVKAFALLTHHPVRLRSLPAKLREQVTGDKQRFYRRDLPADALAEIDSMFVSALRPLQAAGRLGAVLFQFPRWFVRSRANIDYLRELAESFPYPVAVEFRGAGWMDEGRAERTLELLRDLDLAYVVVDEPQGFKSSTPPVVASTSSDLAMVRFHGRNAETWEKPGLTAAERFRYLYGEEELREWVPSLRELAGKSQRLHVLMNNCYADYGVRNAGQLAALLSE